MAAAPPGLPPPPTSSSPDPVSGPSTMLRLLIAVVVLAAVAAGCVLVVHRWSATPAAVPVLPVSPSPSPAAQPSSPDGDTAEPFPPPPLPTSATPATPSSPPPDSTPRPRGTQTLGAPSPTKGRGLTDNDLYRTRLKPGTGRCQLEIIAPPLPDKQLVDYLDTVVDCITTALAPPLKKAGIELERPSVRAYRNPISTPCGYLEPASAPAYYCSGDGVIYVPYRGADHEAYAEARLGYLALIAHEYGHHLQDESGIFDDYTSRYYKARLAGRNQLSRRLELQADCFGGVFLAYVSTTVGLSARDRAELTRWHQQTGDDDAPGRPADHGTSAAQVRWLNRGLDHADYGRCDTWSAAAKDVT